MIEKDCDCGRCNCCNGYVQDAKNPNRYVNLETGKVRNIDHADRQKSQLNWLIICFLIVIFLVNQSQIKTIKPSQTRQSSQSFVD
jgi:hypothetical protein